MHIYSISFTLNILTVRLPNISVSLIGGYLAVYRLEIGEVFVVVCLFYIVEMLVRVFLYVLILMFKSVSKLGLITKACDPSCSGG